MEIQEKLYNNIYLIFNNFLSTIYIIFLSYKFICSFSVRKKGKFLFYLINRILLLFMSHITFNFIQFIFYLLLLFYLFLKLHLLNHLIKHLEIIHILIFRHLVLRQNIFFFHYRAILPSLLGSVSVSVLLFATWTNPSIIFGYSLWNRSLEDLLRHFVCRRIRCAA